MKSPHHVLFCLFLLLVSVSLQAQQTVPKHISKKQFSQLNVQYEQLQKEMKDMKQQRIQLEVALKNYDAKLKNFSQNLEKTEQQYDNVLLQSGEDQLLAASKQTQAMQMSFSLQAIQLVNQIQNQYRQFDVVDDVLKAKLENIRKTARH